MVDISIFVKNNGMVEKQIQTKIRFYPLEELTETEKMLLTAAQEATAKAYAPYSSFLVGAALLLENGQGVIGNNQENIAFPSGLCAERVALFAAHANWHETPVTMLAIAARYKEHFTTQPVTPCGACRQALVESERRFVRPIRLLLYGTEQVLVIESVEAILPLSLERFEP
jgi:cytidine deaminase